MIGADTLVPPTTSQPGSWYVSYTATLRATAETSATVRFLQPVSFCHVRFDSYRVQPLPAPLHVVSVELDLHGPAGVRRRVVGATALIDLAEAAVLGGAGRKAVRLPVNGQVRFRVRVVESVDDGHRLALARSGRWQLVRVLEVGRA